MGSKLAELKPLVFGSTANNSPLKIHFGRHEMRPLELVPHLYAL